MNSIEKYKMFKSYLLMMKYVSVSLLLLQYNGLCGKNCRRNGLLYVNNKLCFDVNIIMFMFMT